MGSKLYKSSHCTYNTKYHIVWIPKYRRPVMMTVKIQKRVEELLFGIAERYNMEIDTVEIESDHIHIFVLIPPNIAISDAVNLFKGISSRKLRQEFQEIKKMLWGSDFWGIGYFVTTVNDKTTSEMIRKYIKNQKLQSKQLKLF